ncbi:hypothetical protein CRV00_12850 [Malaciobacter molluscorum]|uniref:ankyrin repeat domain-containing protein n=1 Tax=Malaciobacter molluscorum TaxID=1032072 RepID=UPI00100AC155|nr:ankyrin repeat domain-containing protein [Malaciobacter molluscorum]RXJ92539.1 hypothetical protein CRV00_12850 [Malaciobacter molluscorum]
MNKISNEEKIKELKDYYQITKSSKIEDKKTINIYKSIENPNAIDETDNEKPNLLHIAIKNNDYLAAKYLISKEANINLKDNYNNTAFHILAKNPTSMENNNIIEDIIQLFLDKKASTQRKNLEELTPYQLAVKNANLIFIKIMIKNKIKMNMTDNKKNTVLHLLAKEAVKNQEEKKFIDHTIIYKSEGIKYTNEELLKIIEYKHSKFIQIAKELVNYGLNIEALNEDNKTAFEIAGELSDGTLGIILKAQYDEKDTNLSTALQTKGKTLHQAIKDEDEKAVEALIKLDANINEEASESPFIEQTPLSIACMNMNISIIEILLKAKADPNYRSSDKEYSSLFWMIKYCHYNENFYKEKRLETVLKMLISYGLNINAPVDNEGNSAIGCAYSSARTTAHYFSYGVFNELFVKIFIEFGADINKPNNKGITPLMQFIMNSYLEREDAFLDLLENDANLSVKDNLGETVLMKAAKNRNHNLMVQMCEIMEDFGNLNISTTNNNGQTALEIAIENNNEPLAQWIAQRI